MNFLQPLFMIFSIIIFHIICQFIIILQVFNFLKFYKIIEYNSDKMLSEFLEFKE